MHIIIGADHNGWERAQQLVALLEDGGHTVVNCTPIKPSPTDDYPVVASAVCKKVLGARTSMGILLCGSGNGMVMAANRFSGIRAALCPQPMYATKARQDEQANVLVLPAWWVTQAQASRIVRAWLRAKPKTASRYLRRIAQLTKRGRG